MAMAQALPNDGVMRAADGTPLKEALARAERSERLKALGLVAPLFIFIVVAGERRDGRVIAREEPCGRRLCIFDHGVEHRDGEFHTLVLLN